MNIRHALLCLSVVALLVAACTPETTVPTPTPTTTPSASTRPHFELATFMYALQAKGKIRVGTQEDNPPFSAKDPNTGLWSGFDVDVARELAKAIYGAAADPATHVEWVPVNAATRVTALTGGTADVVIQTLALTDDNKTQLDLSGPYFHTKLRLLVMKANDQIKGIADLADGTRTVCTQRNAAAEQDVRAATNNGAKIIAVDSYNACLQALQIGAAEAVAANEVVLATLAKADANTTIVGDSFGDRRYAIGAKKNVSGDRQGFVPFLDDFVKQLTSSGTWAKIYEANITPITGDKKQSPD